MRKRKKKSISTPPVFADLTYKGRKVMGKSFTVGRKREVSRQSIFTQPVSPNKLESNSQSCAMGPRLAGTNTPQDQ